MGLVARKRGRLAALVAAVVFVLVAPSLAARALAQEQREEQRQGQSPRAAEPSIASLMTALAGVRESRAAFVEEKALAALTSPLVSRGTLLYAAPSRLEKRTEAPFAERVAVDGDRLTYERPAEGVSRTLSLDQTPELRGLVEAVRGTLAGDLAALRRHYSVGYEGTPDAWRLTLVPVDAKVRELQDFVKAQIAPYKYPRSIEFVPELPRTATGKLQRFRLRDTAIGP